MPLGDVIGQHGHAQSVAQRRRKRRILNAATRIAAVGGYEAVTMRSVAAQATVSVGTLYRYYPSKQHLLLEALRQWLERFDSEFAVDHFTTRDRFNRLWATVDALFDKLCRTPLLAEAMARAYAMADVNTGAVAEEVRLQMCDMLSDALAGRRSQPRDRAVASLLSDVWASNVLAVTQGRMTVDELRRRLATTIGLLATREGAVFGPSVVIPGDT